jgi:hypothetical protein
MIRFKPPRAPDPQRSWKDRPQAPSALKKSFGEHLGQDWDADPTMELDLGRPENDDFERGLEALILAHSRQAALASNEVDPGLVESSLDDFAEGSETFSG